MVAKISFGSSLYGALAYNGEKINKEEGKLLATNKIFDDCSGKTSIANALRDFQRYLSPHIRTEKPVVHISLNPHPDDVLTDMDMENVFIILLVLFNFWTIWFFMREEKERCLPKEGKGEETKPPIDPYEFVPKSQYQYKPPLKENKDEDKTESNMSEPVKEEDVTFEETQQETKSSAQIPDEDLDETFKDCRIEDVPTEYSDEDEGDVPRAKGKSFEDIDLAVRTVKKPKASKAEMVQAGEVFKDLDGTELFARMINDEKLFMQIEASINIAVQAMNEKDTVEENISSRLPDNYEDFNILDFV